MTERPILMSAPMVLATLAGVKTQTRRVVTPQPPAGWDRHAWFKPEVYGWTSEPVPAGRWHTVRSRYGQPGDTLWVREGLTTGTLPNLATVLLGLDLPAESIAIYAADGEPVVEEGGFNVLPWWRRRSFPSIHMPRWASRITLTIADIRVERVQDIGEADARAEGVGSVAEYRALWGALNAGRGFGWDANPWVWVVEYPALLGTN